MYRPASLCPARRRAIFGINSDDRTDADPCAGLPANSVKGPRVCGHTLARAECRGAAPAPAPYRRRARRTFALYCPAPSGLSRALRCHTRGGALASTATGKASAGLPWRTRSTALEAGSSPRQPPKQSWAVQRRRDRTRMQEARLKRQRSENGRSGNRSRTAPSSMIHAVWATSAWRERGSRRSYCAWRAHQMAAGESDFLALPVLRCRAARSMRTSWCPARSHHRRSIGTTIR